MFKDLFDKDLNKEEEFEITEIIPESQNEVQRMLSQLRRGGVIG